MDRDPLHEDSPPHAHWTTGNIGEALPGVPTPLSWTLFGPAIEAAMKGAFLATGAYAPREFPDPPVFDDRITGIFYGRPVLRVDSMATLGDRMPGTSGAQVVEQFYGTVPADMTFAPTSRRIPAIALRLTRNHVRIVPRLQEAAAQAPAWRLQELERVAAAQTLAEAVAVFRTAQRWFDHIVLLQAIAAMCAVGASLDAIKQLAAKAGMAGEVVGLTSGYGNTPEAAPIRDVWRASRGEIDLDELVRRHGQHGPLEGELSARVWREDPAPLERLVREYAQRPDSDAPAALEAEQIARRERLEAELLAALPRAARPFGRAVLDHGRRMIPLRGMAKGQFLRAFDVARAAARRAGALHPALGDPEDVFYLTVDELTGTLPADVDAVIALRRGWRAAHERIRVPTWWTGMPVPVEDAPPEQRDVLTGIGVSAGCVEGTARVVTDPTFVDVEDGEILVSPTTDPGWASIMFISSALVVDIGGHLSHAAVVARELGIPCVVDTGDGSRVIQTGDRLRVDGDAGTVTILRG